MNYNCDLFKCQSSTRNVYFSSSTSSVAHVQSFVCNNLNKDVVIETDLLMNNEDESVHPTSNDALQPPWQCDIISNSIATEIPSTCIPQTDSLGNSPLEDSTWMKSDLPETDRKVKMHMIPLDSDEKHSIHHQELDYAHHKPTINFHHYCQQHFFNQLDLADKLEEVCLQERKKRDDDVSLEFDNIPHFTHNYPHTHNHFHHHHHHRHHHSRHNHPAGIQTYNQKHIHEILLNDQYQGCDNNNACTLNLFDPLEPSTTDEQQTDEKFRPSVSYTDSCIFSKIRVIQWLNDVHQHIFSSN